MSETSDRPLRIVHAVRAPVGGIIRHILDLANGQVNAGHHVGIIADSLTGGERANTALAEIAPRLKLGVRRLAIHREPPPADVWVWAHFKYLISRLKPDVLHGHGAKAGTFIRLRARSKRAIRVYTPHGGSLHYPLDTWKGAIYGRIERTLMNNTDLFLFESAFARDTYHRAVGKPVTLTLAGDGEEIESLKAQIQRLGLAGAVRFIGHVKARYGFSKGTLLVVPSRGDSMPYVVIEAAAAGIPMVAAKVGGIPEIFGPHTDALFAPNIVGAMADAIETALQDPAGALTRAKSLRERIFLQFSQKAMVEGVLVGYRDAFADR